MRVCLYRTAEDRVSVVYNNADCRLLKFASGCVVFAKHRQCGMVLNKTVCCRLDLTGWHRSDNMCDGVVHRHIVCCNWMQMQHWSE